MSTSPSVAEIRQIPVTREGVVPPEYLDENDHMNIVRYLEETARGLGQRGTELGMGEAYLEERRLTTFTAEHHIVYLSELRLGDAFTVHVRFLERSDKVFHAMMFLVDAARDRLSATCEATIVSVGLDSRRPTPFPDDIAAALDAEVAASEALTWAAPVCGAMGVRRRSATAS